jgi:hypothetical protein
MSALTRNLSRIDDQLSELERLVEHEAATLDFRQPEISGWSVRQQVDHSVKVLALGLRALADDREPLPRGINLTGRLLLFLDWIPRGVGRSPRSVVPEEPDAPAMLDEIRRLRAAYREPALAAHPIFARRTPVFPHPYFGGLTAAQGLRFLGCHTHHHWKIILELRQAAESSPT